MRSQIRKNNRGFTIVELLIATGVFSLMLLTMSALIIEISRLYYKGTVITNTQTAARELVESVSQPVRLDNATVYDGYTHTLSGPYEAKSVCIGKKRITYAVNLSSGSTYDETKKIIPHPVWEDEVNAPSECSDASKRAKIEDVTPPNGPAGKPGKDVVGENMRLINFDVSETMSTPGLWNISVGVIYGEEDLINFVVTPPVLPNCKGAVAGSQWCAKASYNTKVFKRIND